MYFFKDFKLHSLVDFLFFFYLFANNVYRWLLFEIAFWYYLNIVGTFTTIILFLPLFGKAKVDQSPQLTGFSLVLWRNFFSCVSFTMVAAMKKNTSWVNLHMTEHWNQIESVCFFTAYSTFPLDLRRSISQYKHYTLSSTTKLTDKNAASRESYSCDLHRMPPCKQRSGQRRRRQRQRQRRH